MKLLGYVRRSQDSGTGVSEEIQREKIKQWAALYDHEVKFLKPDLDESSWTLDRPGMQAALKLLAEGKAQGIVAATQDRLTRRTRDFCNLLELAEEQGWHVFAVDTGLDTTKDSTMHKIMAVFAEHEYRDKKERGDEARRNAVLNHGVHGGTNPPHGYEWTQRLDPETGAPKFDREGRPMRGPLQPTADAPRVKAAFEAFAEGASWTEVTEIAGMKSHGATAAMLSNRVYTGEARSGTFLKEGAHPAIVDRVLFNRVHRKLTVRRRDYSYRIDGQKRVGALLGGGVMRCGHCGYGLVKDGHRYKCVKHGCKKISIGAEAAESYLLLHALGWHVALNPMHIADMDAAALPVFEEAVEAAQAELAEVERMHEAGELTPSAYGKALTVAQHALAAAETALAEAEASRGWLGLDTNAVQRKLVGEGNDVRDIAAGRDFVKQMLRATVKPVGKGTHLPVAERMEIEFLTPRPAVVQDMLDEGLVAA